MKIYTRTGDSGETSLLGGQRVSKDHARIEAYGTVDELNAVIGVVRSELAGGDPGGLDAVLSSVQHQLFQLGAELATPTPAKTNDHQLDEPQVSALEQAIDQHEQKLAPLRQFILPGGGTVACHLHVARCVCRRAERRVVTLGQHGEVRDMLLKYLNRLADLLFVLARAANHATGVEDVPWSKGD